jgi:hypothetical protein
MMLADGHALKGGIMFSKFIQVSAVACALALGGTAVANNNDGAQNQSTQPQPQPQTQTQQQMQPQQQQQPQQMTQQAPQPVQQNNLRSVRLGSLDQAQIKEVQTRLKDVGFYKGAVDGVLGNGTRGALSAYFQSQASLVQAGRISDQALSGFGFSTNDIERVRGVDNGNVNNQRQNTNGQQ